MRDRPWVLVLVVLSLFVIVAGSDSVSDLALPLVPVAILAAVWMATKRPSDDWNKIDLPITERLAVLGAWVAGTIAALLMVPNVLEALILGVIPATAVLGYVRLRRVKRDRRD